MLRPVCCEEGSADGALGGGRRRTGGNPWPVCRLDTDLSPRCIQSSGFGDASRHETGRPWWLRPLPKGDHMLLEGKTAVVTGGTRGIGYAIVTTFLREGAKVALFGSRQETVDHALAKVAEELPDRKSVV